MRRTESKDVSDTRSSDRCANWAGADPGYKAASLKSRNKGKNQSSAPHFAMTHSLWFDLLREWWSEDTRPEPGEALEYAQHREAVMPVIVAAVVALLMVVALMWLPGIP